MSENLILYEPIESENGLSCPYPGCNKCVDASKRTQLEAHIRSHRKRKRKNKNAVSVETVVNDPDDVKVEVVEIQTDQPASVTETERLVEFPVSDDGVTCPYPRCDKRVDSSKQKQLKAHIRSHRQRKRKMTLENDPNQNERIEGTDSDSSPSEATCFDEAMCKQNSQKLGPVSGPTEIDKVMNLDEEYNDHDLSEITDVSKNNDEECVDFTVKIEDDSSSRFETSPVQNDLTPEMTIQSAERENEIILPIDDENHEMKPDIKVEEIDNSNQREQDWFYVKDEDSIKRMFVCKLCFAEYEYLHQLHRHAFACPHKAKIGHTKITSFVKTAFTPYSSTRKKPQPPKLVRTKGNFYCDLCQQVGQTIT